MVAVTAQRVLMVSALQGLLERNPCNQELSATGETVSHTCGTSITTSSNCHECTAQAAAAATGLGPLAAAVHCKSADYHGSNEKGQSHCRELQLYALLKDNSHYCLIQEAQFIICPNIGLA